MMHHTTTTNDVTSLEEGQPHQQLNRSDNRVTRSNKGKFILAAVVVVIFALGLGFGLSNDNGDTKEKTSKDLKSSNGQSQPSTTSDGGKDMTPSTSGSSTTTDASMTKTNNGGDSSNGTTGGTTASTEGIAFVNTLAAISPQSITESYGSCDALKEDLKIVARNFGKKYIDENVKYFEEGFFYTSYEVATARNSDPVATKPAAASGQTKAADAPSNSFGTNNRHAGVEEADVVQSDGTKVYTAYGREIVVLDAATTTVASRKEIPKPADPECMDDYIRGMLLIDTSLVVFVDSWCSTTSTPPPTGEAEMSMIYYPSLSSTKIYIYDTASMTVRTNQTLSGSYVSARSVGPNVHVVTRSSLDLYAVTYNLEPYYLQSLSNTPLNATTYRKKAEEQLESQLGPVVDRVTASLDCTGMQKLSLPQNTNAAGSMYSMSNVIAISSFSATAAAFSKNTVSMMLPSSVWWVYSSKDHVVLTFDGQNFDSEGNSVANPQTYMVAYKLNSTSSAPVMLGVVPGYIMSPTSIDHVTKNGKDYLRVASTTSTMKLDDDGCVIPSSVKSTSQVTVLEMVEGTNATMPVVGELNGLGKPGESIFSVLFQGDRAFVVTFNYTDPLYTIDMSDPTQPVAVGELEVPGFSTYLHPIGADLILGVGRTSDPNSTTFQLSLFNVSDFANPKRIHQWQETPIKSNGTVSTSVYSEAEYDTKSFRYLEDSQILIVPMSKSSYVEGPCEMWDDDYSYNYTDDIYSYNYTDDFLLLDDDTYNGTDDFTFVSPPKFVDNSTSAPSFISSTCYSSVMSNDSFDGFRLFKVDPVGGITSYFTIKHASGDSMNGCFGPGYLPPRSLVFNGDVTTMKGHSIQSHDVTTKQEAATPIDLDEGTDWCSNYWSD